MRPLGMADAVRYAARRVDEDAPGAAFRGRAIARAPAEGHALVRAVRVDAQRVLDARGYDLTAFVERTELFAQAVHRLAGRQRKRRQPLLSGARAADRRQTREAAEMLVGDRREERLLVEQQTQAERLAGELESRAARSERPYAGIGLRGIAALCTADDQTVIGLGVRTDAQAEYAGAKATDFKYVASARRKCAARRRHPQAVGRAHADVR